MSDIYEKLNLTVLDFLSHYQKLNRMTLTCTGVTISQMTILRYLKANGPSRITAIATALSMDAGNVSNICSRLEKAGYIERQFPAKDKRLCLVNVPESTETNLEEQLKSTQDLYGYTREVLSEEEAEQALESLRTLNIYYEQLTLRIKDRGSTDGEE